MGVAMCLQARNSIETNMSSFKFQVQWHASEEEEEEDEEEECVRYPKVSFTSMSRDFNRDSLKVSPIERARTERTTRERGYPLKDRMKERHRSSSVTREGEQWALGYSNMVTDDTLKHLNDTVRVANSIVLKSGDISKELDRQERVLCKAEEEISTVEYDTDVTSQTLKEMSSLRSKIASTVFPRKKPKPKPEALAKIDFGIMNGQAGLCAFSRMADCKTIYSPTVTESSGNTPQQRLKVGMGHLHNALDVITVQQLDTAWVLERQEGRLSKFEDNLGTTHKKINRQSQMINKIMDKQKVS